MKLKRKGSDQSLPSIQILSTLNSHICFSSIRWHPNLTSCLLASKRDAYQSWILSSLHAQHSRSVAADKRASRSVGPQPGFPLRGAKPSGWRVTVYNAGFSPFHALILSIVPELSQLPVHRASKRSCDIASSSVCRTPCFFYLHPVLLCSFQISKHTLCTTIWLFTQLPSLAPPFLVSPRSFSLDAWFPIVNRDCIVPPTDLVCPRLWLFCLSQSPWWIGISTMPATCASGHFHSPSLCFDSLQTTVVFVWRCDARHAAPSSVRTVNVVTGPQKMWVSILPEIHFVVVKIRFRDKKHISDTTTTIQGVQRSPCKNTALPAEASKH